jgi:hypothetical protein
MPRGSTSMVEVEGMPRPVEPLGVSKPSPVTYVRTVKPAGTRMSARAGDDSRRGRARASTAPRLEVRECILRRSCQRVTERSIRPGP